MSQQPTEYPKGLFPGTDRFLAQRERAAVKAELDQLSTEDLKKVLDQAKLAGSEGQGQEGAGSATTS
jgi:hypothetical protein